MRYASPNEKAWPLVDPLLAASYYVEAGLLFETGGQRRVSYSEVETVSVPSL